MPIYEYECRGCGKQLELVQKHTDEPLSVCEACGGELRKLISNTSFVLKGTGWYKTDYASPAQKTDNSGGQAAAQASEAKTETKKEEKKEPAAAK